MTITKMFAETI